MKMRVQEEIISREGGLDLQRPELKKPTVPAPSTIPNKWKWHYRRLRQLREEFHAAQRNHLADAAETKPNFSMSMGDGGSDEFERDLLLTEASSEQEVIYEIEQALKRIESGTYGVCALTGKPIAQARLRAIPWTRFSIAAERRLEAAEGKRVAHLGELRSVKGKDR